MRRMRSLLARPERGATAVMVGLLMTSLVGFTGLAVDGGATYAKYQELQNGADAAALAAAQECAENETDCFETHLDSEAGPYGEANVRNEKSTVSASFAPDVPNHEVTATVEGTQSHWFMPVLGIDESDLSASATATWGGPVVLPLTFADCEFEEALGAAEPGDIIEIHVPKNGSETDCGWGSDYPPGNFGWLTKSGCEVSVEIDMWVDGDTGADAPRDCPWESYPGQKVRIPLFDQYNGSGSSGEFHISQFAALKITGIRPKNGASSQVGDACTGPVPSSDYHKTCVRGEFLELGDPDTDESTIRLID